ncbi:hypothetical protein WA556_003636 [Blastocystis sp. ATCC 50177/Nand II]
MTATAVSLTLNLTCFFLCANSSLLLSIVMQTVRVIDVLPFPVNEPLEERIHPLRTLSTVYASPKKHHTPLFNTITYGSFCHGVMGQLTLPVLHVDPVGMTHFLSITLKSRIISPANRSTPAIRHEGRAVSKQRARRSAHPPAIPAK